MRAPTSASTAAPLRSPVLPSTLAPALATLLVACLGLDEGVPTPDAGPPPDAPAVDAPPDSGPPSPATTGIAVLDHTGAPWEADAAPR
ncbi:MAG TPA: hypothetical protein RMH26_25665, partial [Polyangiaceae bacterium LLY-WYZ-15_(1-7)]|nr:hypothetical protein [Polyangiaceae bacterium LLY-WYZ-15_(1-7)]